MAERLLHDPRALDDGTRLAATVLRGLAALHDEPLPSDAAGRRDLWALHGVTGDELSTTVLVAGLVARGSGPLVDTSREWADAGSAAVVTLAQLRGVEELVGVEIAHVVENPAVLALALGHFGAACPPMIGTSGWPNMAAMLLLRTLAAGGASLRYHGDLDGEGLRIAAYVLDRAGAEPWRMTVADYRGVGDGHRSGGRTAHDGAVGTEPRCSPRRARHRCSRGASGRLCCSRI